MAFSDLELKQLGFRMTSLIEILRPPKKIRNELDIKYTINGRSIYIIEEREDFMDQTRKTESEIAKITYIKKTNNWKIYWMKSDLKWHGYEPNYEVENIEEAIQIIKEDEFACFWG